MMLSRLSRATRRALSAALFWWSLPRLPSAAEAERKRIKAARMKHGATRARFEKLKAIKNAQLRRELGRA